VVGSAQQANRAVAAWVARVKVDGRPCEPGAIFDDVAPSGMSPTLRHAILLPPFLWDDDAFSSRVIDYKTVAWLQVVAITDAERQFCLNRGSDELQTRFEKAAIDVFDPDRPSAVQPPDGAETRPAED